MCLLIVLPLRKESIVVVLPPQACHHQELLIQLLLSTTWLWLLPLVCHAEGQMYPMTSTENVAIAGLDPLL